MFTDLNWQAQVRDTAWNTDALANAASLKPATAYDFVEMLPPALPLIINYRNGGPAGVIVRQLTLTYVGTDLSTITRTV